MYVYLTGRAFLVLFVKFLIEKERYLNFQKDFIIIKFSIDFIFQLMKVYKKMLDPSIAQLAFRFSVAT